MTRDDAPVLVGAAQLVQRDVDPAEALEPLTMLDRAARQAARDAGLADDTLGRLDTLGIVDAVGWRPQNAVSLVAEKLGVHPARQYLSAVGGEIPLRMVNQFAEEIRAGRSRMALLAGCNNVRTLRNARKVGVKLQWTTGGSGEPELIGQNRPGNSEREQAHGLRMPTDVYPIFENALRAHRQLDLDAHLERVGALLAGMTDVAAKNPYAWFPIARSAEEITRSGPSNRMIAYPYTKYMNAVMETDQAAAVLMMAAGTARALGVPEDRWVHWWGGAHDEEAAWYASERPDFARCPALRRATSAALAEAGVSLDEIDHFDFYSCFPVAVEMACEMLALAEDDPRGVTVTGGLPYAGGPGNNYTLHSLAGMMERLRGEPGAKGMVTGNGWYLTKHSATVCSTEPAPPAAEAPPPEDAAGPVEVADEATGIGEIETYTVLYGREGGPERGIALGRLADGRRFLANTPDDRALLEDFVAQENVGRAGRLSHTEGRNVFVPT